MILPSVGAQTGNRLAQMMATQGRTDMAASMDMRQMAFQQQLAAAQEEEKSRMLLMSMLQQRSQQRQARRAARGPGQMSRTFQTLFAGTPVNAFIESDRTVSSGYQPNKDNSIVGFIEWLAKMKGQGIQQNLGQQRIAESQYSMGEGTTENWFWKGGGS